MEFGAKGFQITGLEFWSLVSHSFIHSFIPRNILLRTKRLGNTAKERAGAERVYSSIGKPATGPVYQQVHLTVYTDTCKLPATWLSRRFWETEWRGRRPPLAAPRPRAPAVIVGRAPGRPPHSSRRPGWTSGSPEVGRRTRRPVSPRRPARGFKCKRKPCLKSPPSSAGAHVAPRGPPSARPGTRRRKRGARGGRSPGARRRRSPKGS